MTIIFFFSVLTHVGAGILFPNKSLETEALMLILHKLAFSEHLLCAKHRGQHTTQMITLNSDNYPVKWALLCYFFLNDETEAQRE